ncbi:hypothetical protein ADUPG1_011392 [Aduncisulcus paluster]|uniref:Uncharacterized protein n=1 Tax=Aduncisulcus paluster TaxID=2918883 RepID=A0ABQ5K0F7_9EUKA|nr:hypothetical protein ADUPG1_011392 [Aduncisulcus paluster]
MSLTEEQPSIEDVSSSSSFSRFKNSLATMSMTLNFNGITFSLDINDFTAYSDEPCGVDEDDMAALEERGISSSDMDSFFYRYSPLTSSDISDVSGLDFYADIELFEDSTSNLSISKEFVYSDLTDTDNEGDCHYYERKCSDGIFQPNECLSVLYAKALNIGITPKHTSTYPNTYDVSDDDVNFANWNNYSDRSYDCSSVDYLPLSSLSLNIYDITTYCGIYHANYGGDFGDNRSILIMFCTFLSIIGGCCFAKTWCSCKTDERKKTQREEERKEREEERKEREEEKRKKRVERKRQRASRSSTYQPESELGIPMRVSIAGMQDGKTRQDTPGSCNAPIVPDSSIGGNGSGLDTSSPVEPSHNPNSDEDSGSGPDPGQPTLTERESENRQRVGGPSDSQNSQGSNHDGPSRKRPVVHDELRSLIRKRFNIIHFVLSSSGVMGRRAASLLGKFIFDYGKKSVRGSVPNGAQELFMSHLSPLLMRLAMAIAGRCPGDKREFEKTDSS